MSLATTHKSDNGTTQPAEDPSTTQFEKYVVMRIQKILDGQERLERMLSAQSSKENHDETSEDKPVIEREGALISMVASSGKSSIRWQLRSSLQWTMTPHMSDTPSHSPSVRKWPVSLPVSWPKTLNLKDGFQGVDDMTASVEVKMYRHETEKMIERQSWFHRKSGLESDEDGKRSLFVLMPTHPFRLVLDVFCILCLGVDMVTIPWALAWDVEAEGPFEYIQFVVRIYWTMDIIFTFLSAYVSDGRIVTDIKSIALHYLQRAFVLDLLIVVIDWLSFGDAFTSDESADMAKGMRMGKFGRLFRVVAVFRMTRVSKAYHRVVDYCTVRGFTIIINMFGVLNLVASIVYINHVLGCGWFALSKYAQSDTGARWTDTAIVGISETYGDTTLVFQYTSAFHWALTQMTPGSMQLNAQNSAERVFNIICLIFGVLFFGTLISTLSTKMMALKNNQQHIHLMKATMMTFLQERKVSPSLALVVKRHLEERMSVKNRLIFSNIDAFRFLSGKLLSEVHAAICTPCLSGHPLVVVMRRLNDRISTEVCFQAMTFQALSQHDILFIAGDACSDAFIISEGTMAYTQEPGSSFVARTKVCSLDAATWFCEAALWSEWIHLGSADCARAAEVLKISSVELIRVVKKHIVLKNLMMNYGTAYYKHLITFRRPETLTDISGDAVQSAQLFCHVGEDLKMILNHMSLKIFHEQYGWYGSEEWRRLKDEVDSNRTTLVPISDRNILRCVEVACLKLVRDDGCIFAGVGTWDAQTDRIVSHIVLPGSKVKNWEDPEIALERMCKEDLGSLGNIILLMHLTVEHTLKVSGSYMVDTDYSKNIFEAMLKADSQASSLTESQRLECVEFAQEPILRADFYVCEDAQFRKQVYAWMSPEDLDAAVDGGVDVNRMLKIFDYQRAIDLKAAVLPKDFDGEDKFDMMV